MDVGRVEGPITVSQSYLIGSRTAGETVLPVRAVLATDGTVTLRCVGLTGSAHGCDVEWPLVIADVVGTDSSLEREVYAMMDHMKRYHSGGHGGG